MHMAVVLYLHYWRHSGHCIT